MVNKDKTKDIIIKTAKAQQTLKDLGLNLEIPQDSRKWKSFIRNLREHYLGLSVADFWEIVGLSRSSGTKYESPDNSYSRVPKRRLMLLISEAFDLDWEVPKQGLDNSIDSETSMKMLKMLNDNKVSIKELEILLRSLSDLRKLHSKASTKN